MKRLSVVVIGAGDRGWSYAQKMAQMPEKFEIVAVADPVAVRRQRICELCGLEESACYDSWDAVLEKPKMADVAIIATMDNMHYAPAMKAIERGYNLLLEKPAAQTAEECANLAKAAEKKGVSVLVCHVLRYTPFYRQVKEALMAGKIGTVMSAVLVEGVGNIHQSHSYVRGNWHSEKESTPMLLAKSCHDIDILQWLLDKPCKRVQSFGDLTYFREENAPVGAPVRCADGGCPVANSCPYNCIKLYYEDKDNLWFRCAATRGMTKTAVPTDEEVMKALKTRDYGLCVFHANNDVVDHQVVNMEFEGGATASFSMNAFNHGGRYIRLFGTEGELYANMSDTDITVFRFENCETIKIPVFETEESILGGHAGGDYGIVFELYEYLNGEYNGVCAADISTSVKNHLVGFAAEEARHNNAVVAIDQYFKKFGLENTYP